MAKAPLKKVRRLRHASETVRERAEKAAQGKPVKTRRLAVVGKPFRKLGAVKAWRIWRPFKVVSRFLGKILVPPYIRSSFAELRQVTWPSRGQTFRLTGAVLIFALVFGTIVAIVDFGLDKLFKQVLIR